MTGQTIGQYRILEELGRGPLPGPYFALVTPGLTEVVRQGIVGLGDFTGGSLGTQPTRYGDGISLRNGGGM